MGQLSQEVVKKYQLSVVNFSEKCSGKWTHVIRTTEEKSVLDYIITNEVMAGAVKNLVIDEDCLLCPFSMKKKKGKEVPQYSDHNSMILEAGVEKCKQRNRKTEYQKLLFREILCPSLIMFIIH